MPGIQRVKLVQVSSRKPCKTLIICILCWSSILDLTRPIEDHLTRRWMCYNHYNTKAPSYYWMSDTLDFVYGFCPWKLLFFILGNIESQGRSVNQTDPKVPGDWDRLHEPFFPLSSVRSAWEYIQTEILRERRDLVIVWRQQKRCRAQGLQTTLSQPSVSIKQAQPIEEAKVA